MYIHSHTQKHVKPDRPTEHSSFAALIMWLVGLVAAQAASADTAAQTASSLPIAPTKVSRQLHPGLKPQVLPPLDRPGTRAVVPEPAVEPSGSPFHFVATKPEAKRRCVWTIDGRWKILRASRTPLILSVKITSYGPTPDQYWVKGTATDVGNARVGKLWGNGSDKVFHFQYAWRDDDNPVTHPPDRYEGHIASDGSVSGTARIDQHRGARWSDTKGLTMGPVALERWRREGNLTCKPAVSKASAAGANEDGGVAGAAQPPPSRRKGATQQPAGFAK